MKFIHCADIHLDSKMETNLSSQKAKERKKEILNTFEKMVAYATENDVKGIIIAGDMFDTARITNLTKTRVLNTITKNANIDFLYLSGNHDESNFISLIEDMPKNLKIFDKKWTTFEYENIRITGAIVDENNSASIYDTLNLNADSLNIVVMHGQISKYDSKEKSETINLTKLKNKNIDYLALGHIHYYVQDSLDKRGVYCYTGCLEGRGFDECGDKGFVLLDIENSSISSQFISFAKRQLVEIEFDITNYNNWFDIEEQIIEKTKEVSKDNLLKITLKGKYNIKLDKHLTMLEQKLEKFFFAKIKDESILEVTLKDVEKDISLRGEFIRQVLSSNLTDEEKEQTILVGLKSLFGEDL